MRSVRKRSPCVRRVSASVRAENRRETQNCRHFWTRVASSRLKSVKGSGGSWSRNAELSSLLDSRCVFASQKCQQSHGSGGLRSRNVELSSLLDLPLERREEREKREERGEQRERRGEEVRGGERRREE